MSAWQKGGTYQPHSKKQDLEYSPDGGGADNVAVAHSGHGDHEEIHTLPIAQLVHLAKVRQVATVLQLFFFSDTDLKEGWSQEGCAVEPLRNRSFASQIIFFWFKAYKVLIC